MSVEAIDAEQNETTGEPSSVQFKWLECGLKQAGGKLPLFDDDGQKINSKIVNSCLKRGWVEPWFNNPIKPYWLVCKLTEAGRRVLSRK